MSEEELRRVMERIDTDEAFRDMLGEDPEAALQGFDISPVEAVALGPRMRRRCGGWPAWTPSGSTRTPPAPVGATAAAY